MSRNKKIWLGVLAFLPIVFSIGLMIYVFAVIFPNMVQMNHQELEGNPFAMFSAFAPMFLVSILSMIINLALMIYFIIHAINNPQVKPEERIIWILVMIFASALALPVYWIIRVWPEPKLESNFVKM